MAASLNPADYASGTRNEEEVEFPLLCETCLGPNPFVEMTRAPNYRSCKICERGFTVFRWKPGADGRYKKTEICKTCAKAKNVCQTCIFDMQYGLPVQVRDSVLADHQKIDIPRDLKSRNALINKLEAGQLADPDSVLPQYQESNPILEKLARRTPYYERNKAKLCTFYARGACTRAELCPYRHEMPVHTGEMAKQNIRDRFHGTNDPVANKILRRAAGQATKLVPPDDQSVTTLWVGGVPDNATEGEVRAQFAPFGSLVAVKVVPEKSCAFITYQRRHAAEEAAMQLFNKIMIKGTHVRLAWGKRAGDKTAVPAAQSVEEAMSAETAAAAATGDFSLLPNAPPPPGMTGPHKYSAMSSSFFQGSASAAANAAAAAQKVPAPRGL